MPLKLVPPRAGKTPFWSIRGTYLAGSLDLALDAADTIQGRDCV